MCTNTTGNRNVAIGQCTMKLNTTGNCNNAIGQFALCANTSGCNNQAMGHSAMGSNTTGCTNIGIGQNALSSNTTASNNTAVGTNALAANTTGIRNTAVGYLAMCSVAGAGNENTAMGYSAGCTLTTGDENAFLGYRAGYNVTTGSCNIMIGSSAAIDSGGTNHAMTMGYSVTGIGDALTFGNGNTDSRIAFGATSITAPSDMRLKEDIQDDTAGLSFINDLRPVTYRWRKEKDIPEEMRTHVAGSEKRYNNDKVNHGFIAQEVKEAIDNHPELKNGFSIWEEESTLDGRQRLAEGSLIPMLVNAIKELSETNKDLKSRIEALESN